MITVFTGHDERVPRWIVETHHDGGTQDFLVRTPTAEGAIKTVMAVEKCPRSSILKVTPENRQFQNVGKSE